MTVLRMPKLKRKPRGKGYVLTGGCSHPGCTKRSVVAQKLPLGNTCWWERCEDHLKADIDLSFATMHKLGHVDGDEP
jgi:hypothetical protein